MSDQRSRVKGPGWPVEHVLDWIHDGCVVFNRRLDCVYANEAGSRVFGLSPDRLVDRNLQSSFPTAIASELQRAALEAVANGAPARRTLHDESTARWLEVTLHPSPDGLLAIITDVTSEKRTELELAAQAEYLQQLVDQIPAFLWVIDRDLVVRRIEGGKPMLEVLDRDRLVGLPMATITRWDRRRTTSTCRSPCIDGCWMARRRNIARRGKGSRSKHGLARCAIATATSSASSASAST
jgi:PAS domain S-box-containing protein